MYASLPRYARMTRDMESFYSSDKAGLSTTCAGMFVAVRHLGDWRRAKVMGEYFVICKEWEMNPMFSLPVFNMSLAIFRFILTFLKHDTGMLFVM